MQKHYGVIDLGTNTFHLLIVRVLSDGSYEEVERIRKFIHLAENGIKTIGKAPFQRGLEALNIFKEAIDRHQVVDLKAMGTAALRTASNGQLFRDLVKEQTGITIEIIDGDEEAQLIYLGVRQAIKLTNESVLLMDIGGGSVEFIIANAHQIFWKQSFPIGVAVLKKGFHHTEPITQLEITTLENHLSNTLRPLLSAIQQFPTHTLIGASGTFDVLENITSIVEKHQNGSFIDMKELDALFQKIIAANLEERYAMKEVPDNRAVLIVVALVLLNFVLKKLEINKLGISNYSMKEGILYGMVG